ncbi:6430_t:CDS:1, partial [Cetraspora pellucida]
SIQKKYENNGCIEYSSHKILNKRQINPETIIIDATDVPETTDTIPTLTRVIDNSQATIIPEFPTTSSFFTATISASHAIPTSPTPFLDNVDKLEPWIFVFLIILIIIMFMLTVCLCRDKNNNIPEDGTNITQNSREVRMPSKSSSEKLSAKSFEKLFERSFEKLSKKSFEKSSERSFKGTINKIMPEEIDKRISRSTFEEDLVLRPPLARTPTTVSAFMEMVDNVDNVVN